MSTTPDAHPPRAAIALIAAILLIANAGRAATMGQGVSLPVFLIAVGGGVLVVLLHAAAIRYLWNGILPQIGPFRSISMWHALAIMELLSLGMLFMWWNLNMRWTGT